MANRRSIPGVSAPGTTDLPVLKPFDPRAAAPDAYLATRWVAGLPVWVPAVLVLAAVLWPAIAAAQGEDAGNVTVTALATLWNWIPFILERGFVYTLLISFLAMAIGTALGVVLGLGQVSRSRAMRAVSWFVTQLFRNSPWLVLLFAALLVVPSRFDVFGVEIALAPWIKAVIGLSLPIMANISEIVRGAVLSVPTAQWEAAESLAFTRRQTLWQIILPQCFKRMIPPWMNWYAILTMATPLCSILGVEETITMTQQAMAANSDRPELLVPFYGFALLLFFAYCYPIARMTIRLERRYAVKL